MGSLGNSNIGANKQIGRDNVLIAGDDDCDCSHGGGFSPPLLDHLVFRYRGDLDIDIQGSGATRQVRSWGNIAPNSFNDALTVGAPFPNDAPYALTGDTIDGIQLVTFGVAGQANKGLRTGAVNPGPASTLKNSVGAPMDGSSPRWWVVIGRPDFQAAFGRIGGNPLAHSTYDAIFSIWADAAPENGTAWSHAWQSIDVKWSAGPASALNPYNGVPTLMEWSTDTYPQFTFRVNNQLITTAPTDLSTWTPGAASPLFMGGPGNPSFLGGIAEALGYDRPPTFAQRLALLQYVDAVYPTVPLLP